MKNKAVKIFVADDHPLILKGIIDALNGTEKYNVTGSSVNGKEAYLLIDEQQPELAILDINMNDMNGLEIARMLKSNKSDIKIVILTMYNDENYFNEAIDIGVDGYLLKDCYENELLKCLDTVIAGEFYLSPGVSKLLISRRKQKSNLESLYPELKNLTAMEKKVLAKISENKTSKEIADELFISVRTVQNHRTNICGKLKLKGYNKLFQFAILNKHLINC